MHLVTKEFKFEAAHRLLHHRGKCSKLHGHSYRAIVELFGTSALEQDGMVVDFGVLSDTIGKWIEEHLDHNTMLNAEDAQLANLFVDQQPYLFFGVDPTAERIAQEIHSQAVELLKNFRAVCRVNKVTVYETPTCSATFQ